MTSPGRLFSSMIVSTSAWVAPWAHYLHSLPSIAMTSLKLSVSSCTCTKDFPFLTELIGVQLSMVLAACVSHSVPLLSLVVTVRPIFSCSGFLVSAATRVYAFTCASLCLSSIGGRSRAYLIASEDVSLVHPRMLLMPSFWMTSSLLSCAVDSVSRPKP